MIKELIVVATLTVGGFVVVDNTIPDASPVAPCCPAYVNFNTDAGKELKASCQTAPYFVNEGNQGVQPPLWYPGKKLVRIVK